MNFRRTTTTKVSKSIIVSQHKNNYAVRFYDYFKSFLWKKGFIYNKTFQINNLKVLLGVETAQSYSKNIGSLKQRILDPAVKEINRNTDIVLSYELVKTRQNKITHITFYAKLKSGASIKKSNNVILKIDSLENIKAKSDTRVITWDSGNKTFLQKMSLIEGTGIKIDDKNDIFWN